MNDILTQKVKDLVSEYKNKSYPAPVIVNAIKESLQYYVLNFIYNNKKYSSLVMYGGTLLRICYKLERMSEDLDFQSEKKVDLEELKQDLIAYFNNEFGYTNLQVTTNPRDENETDLLRLNFTDILKDLDLGWATLKLRFDINLFPEIINFEQELIPITKDNYTFSIRTYPISTMMASKLVAVIRRTKRNNRGIEANYKGRDIYDTVWYMQQKIMPNLDYLRAKNINYNNTIELFDDITQRLLNIDDKALKADLIPLFYNSNSLDTWYKNWREIYRNARDSYILFEVTNLEEINTWVEFRNEVHYFRYHFNTKEKKNISFTFGLSDYFVTFSDIKIEAGHRNQKIEQKIHLFPDQKSELKEIDYEYIGLFYKKVEDYLTRNKNVVTQSDINTKLIRYTSDKFDQKTQVIQDKRLLERSKLEDLF